jgi:hypothetical protein
VGIWKEENRVLEERDHAEGFFFIQATEGVNSLFRICRRKFRDLFPDGPRREQSTLGQSIATIIGRAEDEIERQKRFIAGGEPAKLKGYTIYEYFWELNEALRPKKKPANAGK